MEVSLMCNQQLNYELVIDDTNEQQKILNHDSLMYSNYQNSIAYRSIRFLQLIFLQSKTYIFRLICTSSRYTFHPSTLSAIFRTQLMQLIEMMNL